MSPPEEISTSSNAESLSEKISEDQEDDQENADQQATYRSTATARGEDAAATASRQAVSDEQHAQYIAEYDGDGYRAYAQAQRDQAAAAARRQRAVLAAARAYDRADEAAWDAHYNRYIESYYPPVISAHKGAAVDGGHYPAAGLVWDLHLCNGLPCGCRDGTVDGQRFCWVPRPADAHHIYSGPAAGPHGTYGPPGRAAAQSIVSVAAAASPGFYPGSAARPDIVVMGSV